MPLHAALAFILFAAISPLRLLLLNNSSGLSDKGMVEFAKRTTDLQSFLG